MLISAMVGIDLRNTLDMDATIKGFDLTEQNLIDILNEIISIDVEDDVTFEILMIKDIRDEAEYSGYRVTINGKFDTIYQKFKIDISTGDIITPKEIEYNFKLLFEDRQIGILAYNLETVLSEKFEGIISKGIANTRARDYYDIFILEKFQKQNINENILRDAIINKFTERGTLYYLENIDKQINEIENSDDLKEIWENYQNKFSYAKDISFKDTINEIKKIANIDFKINKK
jgi:predicted nucleotidyltransferase component of viral defense system